MLENTDFNLKQKKQIAKRYIQEWWDNGKVMDSEFKTKASFDRAAVKKFPIIVSRNTVKHWREQWQRDHRDAIK